MKTTSTSSYALAESHFRNEDFNRAHFLFSKAATLPGVGDLAEVAFFFSARANLAIPTEEATKEALDTLDRLIEESGRLATSARLLKARTLLKSLGKPRECLETLEGIPGKPGDQPEAAFLTAESYRELASEDPALVDQGYWHLSKVSRRPAHTLCAFQSALLSDGSHLSRKWPTRPCLGILSQSG